MTNLEIIFYYVPVLFCFFVAVALLIKPEKQLAQKYLCGLFAILGSLLFLGTLKDIFIQDTKLDHIIYFINVLFNILCAISVLFYFVALMQPQKLTHKYILFFGALTFFYTLVMCIPELFDRAPFITVTKENFNLLLRLLGALCEISLEIYTITTVTAMYFRHRRFIRENYSYEEDINFRWVFISNGVLVLAAVGSWIWTLKGNTNYSLFFNLNVLIAAWVVFVLGYKNRQIPLPEKTESKLKADEHISVVGPSSRQIQTREALLSYFEKERPYLNPSLSLTDVADAISSKPSYLSRLINQEFNVNFYAFVNNCRLDYAILLMREQKKNLIIKNLYMDAGFKSRSVFYRFFHERTGLSPKVFQKNIIKHK